MSDESVAVHPGKVLAKEMQAIGINGSDLARRIDVPNNRIYQLVNGKRNLTADTALRFARVFNTTPEYWLHLQAAYELEEARSAVDAILEKIQPYAPPEAVQSTMSL